MKREERKKREELKKAQYKGIVKALEKKKEGAGSYGRPTVRRTISRWRPIAERPH